MANVPIVHHHLCVQSFNFSALKTFERKALYKEESLRLLTCVEILRFWPAAKAETLCHHSGFVLKALKSP